MSEDGGTPSVDEFVEYCRTQAGLLTGRAETLGEAVSDLLDEIDDDIATARAHLDDTTADAAGTVSPTSTERPVGDAAVADLEALEDDVETKQAVVEAKQARMVAFQDLAADYTDLAAELRENAADGRAALNRVVDFEADRDAPAYFPDRTTVLEAAADAGDSDGEPADSDGESPNSDGGPAVDDRPTTE